MPNFRLSSLPANAVRLLGARAYLLAAAVFTLLALLTPGALNFGNAQARLFDEMISHRLRHPQPAPDIVILDIDERSLAGMAADFGRWPWPNRVLGDVVGALEANGVRAIVFDILFSDRDVLRPDSDAAFDAAIAASRTTYFPVLRLDPRNDALSQIPMSALPGVKPISDNPDSKASVAMVLPKVPAALDNGRLGSNQVEPDRDGIIRNYLSWIDHAGWRLNSLPQSLAVRDGKPGADRKDILLNWRGPPFSYRYVSFVDLWRDIKRGDGPLLQAMAGKTVIIGSTAPSLFDIKASPLAKVHPGVEILATAIDNYRHGDYLRVQPAWISALAALALVWGMALALYRQVRIEIFDRVFGVLQGVLLALSYLLLNVSHWYLDPSGPLSIGLGFFAVSRAYYGLSRRWLADSQLHDIADMASGQRRLALLALRLPGMRPAERRQLKADIDHLVAKLPLHPARIVNLVEDPGFVNNLFQDTMLVYWLLADADARWQDEAQHICHALQANGWQPRLQLGRHSTLLTWNEKDAWRPPAYRAVLAALQGAIEPAQEAAPQDTTSQVAQPAAIHLKKQPAKQSAEEGELQ